MNPTLTRQCVSVGKANGKFRQPGKDALKLKSIFEPDSERLLEQQWKLRMDVNRLEANLKDERRERLEFEVWAKALLLGEEECPALPAHLSVLDDSEMSDASKGFGEEIMDSLWTTRVAVGVCMSVLAIRLMGSVPFLSLVNIIAHFGLCVILGTLSYWIYRVVVHAVCKTEWQHPFRKHQLGPALSLGKAHSVTTTVVSWLNVVTAKLQRLILVENPMETMTFGSYLYILIVVIEKTGPILVHVATFDSLLILLFLTFFLRILMEIPKISFLKGKQVNDETGIIRDPVAGTWSEV